VRLREVDSRPFLSVLEFIYTGRVEVAKEGCEALLRAADLFLIDDLKNSCAKKMADHITADSVFSALQLATMLNLGDLKAKCTAYIIENMGRDNMAENFAAFAGDRDNAGILTELFRSVVRKRPGEEEEGPGPAKKHRGGAAALERAGPGDL
jgi:hypothetical protein